MSLQKPLRKNFLGSNTFYFAFQEAAGQLQKNIQATYQIVTNEIKKVDSFFFKSMCDNRLIFHPIHDVIGLVEVLFSSHN